MPTYEQTIHAIPADPDRAWNYQALLALWKEQSARAGTSPEELKAWEQRVLECLRHGERHTFLDETVRDGESLPGTKLNRLTKILLGRHPGLGATVG